ncbi:MAG: uncharacterized membrane protein (UPF0127 family) [Candidatus Omnitrophota bacterium]|jgi:uncharacterized membrane protein (UPF0127 family)
MSFHTVTNVTKHNIIADKVKLANTFMSRLVGLIGRSSLSEQEGLIITHCNSIHMVFMRFPIDVVFLDKVNKVVGLVKSIKPYRLSAIFFKASYAVELPSGSIISNDIKINDVIEIKQNI